MKIIQLAIGLLILLAAAAVPVRMHAAGDDQERGAIRTTTMFAFGGVGIAGTLLPAEVAYHKIYQRKDAAAIFAALINDPSATSEGKLYALIGLRLRDPAAYRAASPGWLKSTQLVSTAAGCLVSAEPVGQLAREIDQGVWDERGKK